MIGRGGISSSSFCVLLLLVWIALIGGSSAEQGRYYDELLWSKRNWPEFTLKFPLRGFLFGKSGSESRGFSEYMMGYRQSLENGRYESTIMDGGYKNVVEHLLRDGAESLNRGDGQVHGGDVLQIQTSPFGQQQRDSMVSKMFHGGAMISSLLECAIQESLNEILWPVVANWTLRQGAILKDGDLLNLAEEACTLEVPTDILRDKMLLHIIVTRAGDVTQARISGTFGDMLDSLNDPSIIESIVEIMKHSPDKEWKNKLSEVLDVKTSVLENMMEKKGAMSMQQILGASNQDQEYYIALTKRGADNASPLEIATVTSACSDVILNKSWRNEIMDSQKLYLSTALSIIEYTTNDENNGKSFGPKLDRACLDFHPQCEYWARKGECIANPKYMVGSRKTGQCRLACGACEKRDLEALPSYLSAKNAQYLEDIYIETSSSFVSRGCVKSDKEPMSDPKESLEGILREHSSSHANIADQMIEARGPITLKTIHPESLDQIKILDSTTINHESSHQDAVVKLPETLSHYPDAVQRNDVDDSSQSLLWEALQDKCVYKNDGYWSYQVCHGISVEQYHTEDPSILKPAWSIQLGHFEPTKSSFDIVETEASLHDKHHVPAILHVYEGGSDCTVDEKEYNEEFDKGRPEQRKSMVYFLCSPDTESHMTVKETSRCVYRIEVYLPKLCESKEFKVAERDTEVTQPEMDNEDEYSNTKDGEVSEDTENEEKVNILVE